MSDVIEIDADVTETEYLTADVTESVGGGGGATDYVVLVNKPQINGVTLVGDLSTEDLGIHAGVQDVLVDDVSIVDSNHEAHIPIANQQRTGLIPDTWMDKLFHIENGAQRNVQADWNQTFSTFDDYIKNKPNLATVATSGSYNDLSNKPKISEIENDAGYVAYLSQFGIAYLEATDDYAGTSLNEGKFFTGYMPQTQPAPLYLSNGSLIAVKFPTDAVRRPREGGAYAAPALRIYTRRQPPDAYTSYIPINYKGTMIPSKQIKANDIALLVYDSDNDCFEHLGHTDVEQYSATKSGIVPAAGNVSETGEWKLLSNMGWLTVGAIPDYDNQYIYWARKHSPAFTGVPTAPTAASGTDTTQIATTAFVQDAVQDFDSTLGSKSSLTTSDFIRVVGSDNVSYKQDVDSLMQTIGIKYEDLGSFSTQSALETALNTKLNAMPTNSTASIRFSATVSFGIFSNGVTYICDLRKGGSATYASISLHGLGINAEIVGNKSSSTWTFKKEPTRAEVDALNSKIISRDVGAGQTLTIASANARYLLTTVAGTGGAIGLYAVYGYNGGADLQPIKATATTGIVTNSGANVVINNTTSYNMTVGITVYRGSVSL